MSVRRKWVLWAAVAGLSLSGCAMLKGVGKGKAAESEEDSGTPFDNVLDQREAAIEKGSGVFFSDRMFGVFNPADTRGNAWQTEVQGRLAEMDKAWAKKIGPRAVELLGDGHRAWGSDQDLVQEANKVVGACPMAEFKETDPKGHFYRLGQYDEFEKAVSEAFKNAPEALHLVQPINGNYPRDVLSVVLGCEQHRQAELNLPDGVSEAKGGPTDRKGFEDALLKMLPPFKAAQWKDEHDTAPGCGFKLYKVEEEAMGGGRFGEAQLAELSQFQGQYEWTPRKCNKFPKPGHRFAREAAQAKNSLTRPLGPGELIYIGDDANWEVERDERDEIVDRFVVGKVFRKQANLPLYCGSKNPTDACYKGGSWVMTTYEAAKQRLTEAANYQAAQKQVHCRVAAWAAYNLAGEPEHLRRMLQSEGNWVEDMRYVPQQGAPMDERGLMKASDELKAKAKAQFQACGGQGAPLTDSDWSDIFTNYNHSLFKWLQE